MKAQLVITALLLPATLLAQAAIQTPAPPAAPPTLDEVRKEMGIPSQQDVRGQKDIVGFASTAAQMQATWDASASWSGVEKLGEPPTPGVVGALCAHDDYIYAGRVYRKVLPLVTAKTVVLVGVFHRYRRFGAHDIVAIDPYRAWRAPDGDITISSLRDDIVAALPVADIVRAPEMSDSEHSLEAIAYWLKHARKDVEIVPILVPAAEFPRLQQLATRIGAVIATSMKMRGWQLGRDVAVVISSDAVHYGADFNYTPYGEGGVDAYVKAYDRDRQIMRDQLAGTISAGKARDLFSTWVNPGKPTEYRMTWCGRFSVPFGMILMEAVSHTLGGAAIEGKPVAYATSVGGPELPLRAVGLGETAPANLFHFVGLPGAVFVYGQ